MAWRLKKISNHKNKKFLLCLHFCWLDSYWLMCERRTTDRNLIGWPSVLRPAGWKFGREIWKSWNLRNHKNPYFHKYKSCGRADSENYVNCNVNIQLITQHFVYDTFYRAGKYEICEYKPWQQHQLLILFQPKVRICKLGFMSHLTFSFNLLDVFFRNIISPEIIKKTHFR